MSPFEYRHWLDLLERAWGPPPGPRPDALAKTLGMSPRTMRRHLRVLGLSYRGLRDDARFAYAEALLQAGMPTVQVAAELGMSSAKSLWRFCTRRCGRAPSVLRTPRTS